MNLLLTAYAQDPSYFFRFAKKLAKSADLAEDLVQIAIEKVLTYNVRADIKSPKTYLCQIIKNAYLNHIRDNKMYIHAETYLDNQAVDLDFERDLHDSIALRDIGRHAQDLAPKQKSEIEKALAGIEVGDDLGEDKSLVPQYQSHKTNRRLATLKIKQKIGYMI